MPIEFRCGQCGKLLRTAITPPARRLNVPPVGRSARFQARPRRTERRSTVVRACRRQFASPPGQPPAECRTPGIPSNRPAVRCVGRCLAKRVFAAQRVSGPATALLADRNSGALANLFVAGVYSVALRMILTGRSR